MIFVTTAKNIPKTLRLDEYTFHYSRLRKHLYTQDGNGDQLVSKGFSVRLAVASGIHWRLILCIDLQTVLREACGAEGRQGRSAKTLRVNRCKYHGMAAAAQHT